MRMAVIGLGYVGILLSLQFARSGVEVLGLDIDPVKVRAVNAGQSYFLEKAVALYARAIKTVVPVSSCRAAEAAKLLENIFRSVNIALVNELKVDAVIIATAHNAFNFQELADWSDCIIDTRNALAAVKTRPGTVWKA